MRSDFKVPPLGVMAAEQRSGHPERKGKGKEGEEREERTERGEGMGERGGERHLEIGFY